MVGEVIAERYELEELVGSGGMSSVFKARDTLLERRVALKVLHQHFTDDDQYVERFRREARAVASLSHPNIVTILDRGEDEGRQFIVFELVEDRATKEPASDLATAVVDAATARGLLLLKAGIYSNCIRVLTPLVILNAELDEALGVWEDALAVTLD